MWERDLKSDLSVVGHRAVLTGEVAGAIFVDYVMVGSATKGRGLATLLLAGVLDDVRRVGYPTCRAVISDGNTPSEWLFESAGFRRAAE